MPKVSVLTPVWNEEKYIDEMVQSLIDQDHEDWELLLVDDGSSDGSAAAICNWAEKDSRVKAVSLGVKLGKIGAFNRAFAASQGDIICLSGGDDTLPRDSLSRRAELLAPHVDEKVAAFFKLRTFSEERRFDGAVLPRRGSGSRSGGSMTVTRPLADIIFPIADGLPSEDTWLAHAIEAVADRTLDDPTIVLNYRIHKGNSNPRHLDFPALNESLHRRMKAVDLLLEQDRFDLPAAQRRELEVQARAEALRYAGRTRELLRMKELRPIDRLALAQASDPRLRWLRDRVYLLTSGWRGR